MPLIRLCTIPTNRTQAEFGPGVVVDFQNGSQGWLNFKLLAQGVHNKIVLISGLDGRVLSLGCLSIITLNRSFHRDTRVTRTSSKLQAEAKKEARAEPTHLHLHLRLSGSSVDSVSPIFIRYTRSSRDP